MASPGPEPRDELHLTLRRRGGREEHRWWRLVRPPPSRAFALQTLVVRAFGSAYDRVAGALLATMEDTRPDEDGGIAGVGDAATRRAAEVRGADEALALETFRRATTGHALFLPGEDVASAGARLRAVASMVLRATGGTFDAVAVAGEYAGDGPVGEYEWRRVGLAHRLLYDSDLEFGGGDPKKFTDPCPANEPLEDAKQRSPTHFVEALDRVLVSAEELRLLAVWAGLHLIRPF